MVITNTNRKILSTTPLSKVDAYHPSFDISLDTRPILTLDSKPRVDHNFYIADYINICLTFKSIDWLECFKDCQKFNNIFYDKNMAIIDKCVSKKKTRHKTYPLWFTQDLTKLLKEKHELRSKHRKYNN